MITLTVFLAILALCATATSYITTMTKKLLDSKKVKYSSNVVVLITSIVVAAVEAVIYYIDKGVEFNLINIGCILLIAVANWFVSMYGYDKVKQTIEQMATLKAGIGADKYIPRLTAPSLNDAHYYSSQNIYESCGMGMSKASNHPNGGNCTAYVWGRLFELTGKRFMSLVGNAEQMFLNAAKAGLKTGMIPKLGAIICWKDGDPNNSGDGCGHVGIVEKIYDNGELLVSMSGWNTYIFKTEVVPADYSRGNHNFQGFIYCGIEYEDSEAQSKTIAVGMEFNLNNVIAYGSERGSSIGKRTGKYFVWGSDENNGRIKMTNRADRAGVPGQVSFFVDVTSLTTGTKPTSTIKADGAIYAGKEVNLNNATWYTSESAVAHIGKRSGKYYLWDAIVKNGRIRITNKPERVGVPGQVTCWIPVELVK